MNLENWERQVEETSYLSQELKTSFLEPMWACIKRGILLRLSTANLVCA